jgi:hypothetical protein
MTGVNWDYRNFATGGYWGIADFLTHIGVNNRCREEGGSWNAAVIMHYTPGGGPQNQQTYRGQMDMLGGSVLSYFSSER